MTLVDRRSRLCPAMGCRETQAEMVIVRRGATRCSVLERRAAGRLPPRCPMCEALSSPSIMFIRSEYSLRPRHSPATGRYLARIAFQSRLFIAGS